MKKILIILLVILLPSVAFASSDVFQLTKAEYPINVNGELLPGGNLPPLVYQGNTYLPLRKVAEALSTNIQWTGSSVEINTLDLNKLAESCVMTKEYKNGKYNSYGSGVVWDYGKILTCYHTTDEGDTWKVIDNSGTEYTCSKGITSSEYDAAILNLPDKNMKPVKIGDSDDVKVGDKVYAIISPKENKNQIAKGKITKIDRYHGINGFQTDIVALNGSSGGALFDAKGSLVAIIQAYDPSIQKSFAIPINDIRKALVN